MFVRKSIGLFFVVGVGLGMLGLTKAQAKKANPLIRISLAIPQLCNGENGTPALPRFLPVRYGNERFPVVIENVSNKPLQVWAEGNSIGDATLTFEITGPDGKTTVVRPIARGYSKNILRTQRLLPGEHSVREINYHAGSPQWEGFPSLADGKPYKVTVRAVLTQTPIPDNKNPELWVGKAVSAPQEVVFER